MMPPIPNSLSDLILSLVKQKSSLVTEAKEKWLNWWCRRWATAELKSPAVHDDGMQKAMLDLTKFDV